MAAKPVIYDDDAPELTDAELAAFRPARAAMTPERFATVSSVRKGRPKAARPKVPVTIRLDPVIVEAFKATGPRWQTRMNDALMRASETGRFLEGQAAGGAADDGGTVAPAKGKAARLDAAGGIATGPGSAKRSRPPAGERT